MLFQPARVPRALTRKRKIGEHHVLFEPRDKRTTITRTKLPDTGFDASSIRTNATAERFARAYHKCDL